MRLKLISCEVLYREMCQALARSPHRIDVEFLSKGLHDLGSPLMLERLRAAIARIDTSRYDAILLGYALCGNGIVGLRAPRIPLVIPRAHDCITLFFGSRDRYLEYFNSHPGVYFKTTGWMERGEDPEAAGQLSIQARMGMNAGLEELTRRYGEDNARFLVEELGDHMRNYRQITFIEMGVEPDGRFEREAREQAAKRGWLFAKEPGDMGLIQRLVDGQWASEDFLIVPPGCLVVPSYDERIIVAAPNEHG